jgi:hypothetical protein
MESSRESPGWFLPKFRGDEMYKRRVSLLGAKMSGFVALRGGIEMAGCEQPAARVNMP